MSDQLQALADLSSIPTEQEAGWTPADLDVSDMTDASCLCGIKPLFICRPAQSLFLTIYFVR